MISIETSRIRRAFWTRFTAYGVAVELGIGFGTVL